MSALGRRGGMATKERHGSEFFKRIGSLGGKRAAKDHKHDAVLLVQKRSGGAKGGQRLRELVAAGRAVEALTK